MEFESLQAIWDTQNDKPVFAIGDARLLVALYQQRERSRRRIFKQQFAPVYAVALMMLAVLGWGFVIFLRVASLMRRFKSGFPHNGVAMTAWDYVGFAVAAGALLAMVAILHGERKKHERAQEVFAPSLREELDRGIAQLDFEIDLQSTPRVMKILALLSLALVVMNWEEGRTAGNATPWWSVLASFFCVFVGASVGFAKRKKTMERVLARRRALESMRAALDEDTVVVPRK